MATYHDTDTDTDSNTPLLRTAVWLLPFLVGGLCVFAIGGLRARTPRSDASPPHNIGASSQNVSSSSQGHPAPQLLGPVDSLTPVIGDWNQDGRDETGVYHPYCGSGRFVVDSNDNGSPDPGDGSTLYGPSSVTPVAGDWNGDGRHQIGFFGTKDNTGEFILDSNDNGTCDPEDRKCDYGLASDRPIVGDWNGDGRDEVGNFRAAGDAGQFILDSNGNGVWDPTDRVLLYGYSTDMPIIGDWNGDGRDDVGNFRMAGDSGQFILDSNGNGVWDPTDRVFSYGLPSDAPIIGDWDGDGRDEIGNFRIIGNQAQFILDSNGSGLWEPTDRVQIYGSEAEASTVGKQTTTVCRNPSDLSALRCVPKPKGV